MTEWIRIVTVVKIQENKGYCSILLLLQAQHLQQQQVKNVTNFSKMSTFRNFMSIFAIAIRKAFK